MPRSTYRYSLDRRDAKLAGVCSTIGDRFGIDPTFVRVGFVAAALLISLKLSLALYAGVGIFYLIQKHRRTDREQVSEFDRMERSASARPSVKGMLNDLDPIDRRLMAIDDHLNTPNDALAREIDALKEEK